MSSTHSHPVGALGYFLRLARRSKRVRDKAGPHRVEQSNARKACSAWRTLEGITVRALGTASGSKQCTEVEVSPIPDLSPADILVAGLIESLLILAAVPP